MTFYYYFHGDNPHFGVIKLFINIELTTRDIWSGHDVTNETRRKWNFVKDCALSFLETSVLEKLCNSIVLHCQHALHKANSMWGKQVLRAKAVNLQGGYVLHSYSLNFIQCVLDMTGKEIMHYFFQNCFYFWGIHTFMCVSRYHTSFTLAITEIKCHSILCFYS